MNLCRYCTVFRISPFEPSLMYAMFIITGLTPDVVKYGVPVPGHIGVDM